MKQRPNFILLDVIVIILQVTYNLSLTRVITFDIIPLPWNLTIFFFMLVVYLIRFGLTFSLFRIANKHFILYILFFIYLVDFIQTPSIIRIVAFGDMCIFISYLYNLYLANGRQIEKIEKTYLSYCYYNLIVVVLAFILIGIGVLSPTSNELPINSIIEDNIENNNSQEYYFPGYLSLALRDKRLFSDMGIPLLTGLSHEPHVLCYLIFPGLFLSLGRFKKKSIKFLLLFAYVAVLLIAFSTTAFLCFSAVLLFELLWRVIIKRQYFGLLVLIASVFIIVNYNMADSIVSAVQEEILLKTVEQTGSMETSTSVLQYIASPSGLFGSGNFQEEKHGMLTGGNIGYITFVLDILFYLSVLFLSIKKSLSTDLRVHYVGMACLYFYLHFLKVPFFSLEYPFFIFILFLLLVDNKFSNSHQAITSVVNSV